MNNTIQRYNNLNNYLAKRFGCKVYKLALSGGVTCPNRDGKCGTRGCIFCSAGGSGEFAENGGCVTEQIERAKQRVRRKISGGKYIAYFQSYTFTYQPVHIIKEKIEQAINAEDICAVSVATRPDCLDDNIISILSYFNNQKPIWVELGLQTIHEESARYIRRGYSLDVYDSAISRLKSCGLTVITHVIIGLPHETKDMMIQTARYAGEKSDGIKLQLLHVLKGTDLEREYQNGAFDVLSMNEYIDILCSCIENIPQNVVIHRMTGDGDKKILIAPMWSGSKKVVINSINQAFENQNIMQGRLYK